MCTKLFFVVICYLVAVYFGSSNAITRQANILNAVYRGDVIKRDKLYKIQPLIDKNVVHYNQDRKYFGSDLSGKMGGSPDARNESKVSGSNHNQRKINSNFRTIDQRTLSRLWQRFEQTRLVPSEGQRDGTPSHGSDKAEFGILLNTLFLKELRRNIVKCNNIL